MKKLLLASAIAALTITAAHAAPTVYGKAFLTLDVRDGDDNSPAKNSRSQLNSNASRIGLKGSEALTANTDVVYQLEYRVDVDRDAARNFESRDTYLGLANKKFGTLVAGRLTTIDDYVNYTNVTTGGVIGGDDVLASVSGERANNAFAYFSPEYNGVQLMAMYALDEIKGDDATENDTAGRDAWGVAAKYEPTTMPLKVGASYLQAGQSERNVALFDKTARISAAYAFTPAITGAAQYQFTDFKSGYTLNNVNYDKKESAIAVSGSYKVAQTPWTAYAQYDFVDNALGVKDYEKQRFVVGGKYAFNQNTTGHIYGGYLKDKKAPTQVTNAVIAGTHSYDSYGIGAGLEYKF